ncbi:MAG: bifunctional adenosylcobinamide kinase/adenosylcobinamide-phosphate guanylyltransferase [Clostridia bacterium]|jgi:adenosylcobinamide kinase/adenosylcobinamide-phosphate guanylyltransferase|nr:bifunctional adenosylcobinamide kinase/adenosylcobinamide-phosphate guanylyltransferase [Clostridia bacterium]
MTKELILVTGGVRSGKSLFAEKWVKNSGKEVIYLATAQCKDQEMEQRIKLHQLRRPDHWVTIEEPNDIPSKLIQITEGQIILIDCLTIYLTNHLLKLVPDPDQVNNWWEIEGELLSIIDDLVEAAVNCQGDLVIVSNEIGLGLVPPYILGRVFRDLTGLANQKLSSQATKVFFVVAGIPLELKSLAFKDF